MFQLPPNRRQVLALGLPALALAVVPQLAAARDEDVTYAVLQDFGRITPQDGRILLDLPGHSDAGTSVPLTLTVDSPMTDQDFPEEVGIYGSGNPRPRIATAYFTPANGRAEFSTRIRLNSAQDVVAVARTSRGEYWRASRRVGVTFGACATAGESDGLAADWQPSTKVSVPAAVAGEVITIRTVITHPMETGLRLDDRNAYVPLRIIQRFACRLNGVQVFGVKLEPAISTNPYLAFTLRAERSGLLEFEWLDTTGDVWRNKAELVVS